MFSFFSPNTPFISVTQQRLFSFRFGLSRFSRSALLIVFVLLRFTNRVGVCWMLSSTTLTLSLSPKRRKETKESKSVSGRASTPGTRAGNGQSSFHVRYVRLSVSVVLLRRTECVASSPPSPSFPTGDNVDWHSGADAWGRACFAFWLLWC